MISGRSSETTYDQPVVAAADDDTIVFVIHTDDLTHPLTQVVLTCNCLMKIGKHTYNHSP